MEVFLASVEAAYADPATYYWLIQLRSSPDIIGALFVDDLSERSRWCEVDYQLGSAYWGRGYATEALGAALDYLFRRALFHRVQGKCVMGNRASARVMEKCGMVREGTLRGWYWNEGGPGLGGCGPVCRPAGGRCRLRPLHPSEIRLNEKGSLLL